MFNLMKDRKTPAVVEKVLSGSRFKLSLPKHNSLVVFNVSGISTNVGSKEDKVKPFYEESILFSVKKLGNRDVEVIIERCDKNGNFIGQIFFGEENFSEEILKEGLAYISHGIANRFKNYNELVKAENIAKNAKKNIFSLPEEQIYANDSKSKKIEKPKFSKDAEISKNQELFSIRITEFVGAGHFFLQIPEAGEQLEKIGELMKTLNLEEASPYTPKMNELCIAQFSQDKNWYRAKCISMDKEKKDTFTILYIDFGNKETVTSSCVRKIDEKLIKIPIIAKEAFLAFVSFHDTKYKTEALEYVRDYSEDNELSARHEYTIGNRIYLTVLDESNTKSNLNSDLLRNGLAFLETRRDIIENPAFEKQIILLSKDEEEAKRDRVFLWEDGDIYFKDDDE